LLASANHGRPPVGAMDRVGGQRFEPQPHAANANHAASPGGYHNNVEARPEANRSQPYRAEPNRTEPNRSEGNRGAQRPAPQEHSNPEHSGGHPEEHPHHI
jgi:hypothetical protein